MTEPDHTDATGAPPVPEIDVLLLFAGEHPIHAPIAPVQAQRLPPQPALLSADGGYALVLEDAERSAALAASSMLRLHCEALAPSAAWRSAMSTEIVRGLAAGALAVVLPAARRVLGPAFLSGLLDQLGAPGSERTLFLQREVLRAPGQSDVRVRGMAHFGLPDLACRVVSADEPQAMRWIEACVIDLVAGGPDAVPVGRLIEVSAADGRCLGHLELHPARADPDAEAWPVLDLVPVDPPADAVVSAGGGVGQRLRMARQVGTDLREAQLAGEQLAGLQGERIDASGADLSGACLRDAVLHDCLLDGACLASADLGAAILRGCRLEQLQARGALLAEVEMTECDGRGACLIEADLRRARLDGTCLDRADLRAATLDDATGADLSLRGADLGGASLRGVHWEGVDLRGADLRGSCLDGARLPGADLRGAVLDGVDLTHVELTGARRDAGEQAASSTPLPEGVDILPALLSDVFQGVDVRASDPAALLASLRARAGKALDDLPPAEGDALRALLEAADASPGPGAVGPGDRIAALVDALSPELARAIQDLARTAAGRGDEPPPAP